MSELFRFYQLENEIKSASGVDWRLESEEENVFLFYALKNDRGPVESFLERLRKRVHPVKKIFLPMLLDDPLKKLIDAEKNQNYKMDKT